MALQTTVSTLKTLLEQIMHDLGKAERGNKAASQRVRTGTIKLEKTAKIFRKESVKADKQTKGKKKAAKPAKKAATKKAAKPAKKTSAKPKAKTAAKKATSRARPFSVKKKSAKKRTAKMPRKSAHA